MFWFQCWIRPASLRSACFREVSTGWGSTISAIKYKLNDQTSQQGRQSKTTHSLDLIVIYPWIPIKLYPISQYQKQWVTTPNQLARLPSISHSSLLSRVLKPHNIYVHNSFSNLDKNLKRKPNTRTLLSSKCSIIHNWLYKLQIIFELSIFTFNKLSLFYLFDYIDH